MARQLPQDDMDRLSIEGPKLYEQLRSQYEPRYNGEFLAIEVESGKAYRSPDNVAAVRLAEQAHPGKKFYLVKIGYDSVAILATPFFEVPHRV